MTKGKMAIDSLKTTYRKKIFSNFIRGIRDFDLIKNGDKIAVGVSGGKDSLLLCKLFQILKQQKNLDFQVIFISMNPGFGKEDLAKFKKNLDELDISCEIFDANVWEIAFGENQKNPCFLCAKMRRGVLYKKVEELGCNKLALGHHFNDVVETVMINMFYASTIKTMLPKVESTSGNLEIIRPMVYIKEKDIINYTQNNNIEPMSCGCPVEGQKVDSKRKEMKILLEKLEETNPNIKLSIFNSVKNINLDYVMGFTRGNKKDKKVI